VIVKATHHQRGAGCSTTPEILSVSQLKLRLFKTSGTCASGCSASLIISGAVAPASIKLRWFLLEACDADVSRVRLFRIGVANPREVACSRIHVQILEQPITAVLRFHFRNAAFRILYVAKNNRFRGTALGPRRRKQKAGHK